MKTRLSAATLALALAMAVPAVAHAFCGFYVSGADGKLFNNATLVVLMREGQRTVLSMQNNYQGPPQNFAMVVPVPQVLQKENVKTLPREIFDKIDQLAAPRLVEYWEQDPCAQNMAMDMSAAPAGGAPVARFAEGAKKGDLGVKIEAQFTVGEYEVLILSAKDSTGLDTWLRREKYNIPDGAEPLLRPYVEGGMKFFVAKVDVTKVKFDGNQAMLSPLRFHYDSEKFSLPVRLGLINSNGTQDLIVHVLGRGTRYEVANYANVTIPTNLDVDEKARGQFGSFYAALFDRTLEKNPHAVVTEYSWDASSCDPCPTPALDPSELATLGEDALPSAQQNSPGRGGYYYGYGGGFVITRLHVRYGKDSLGEDLVFRTAPPIAGGREVRVVDNKLEHGASPGNGINNFQARYAIRHPWTGPLACTNPVRGVWGGPPSGTGIVGDTQPKPATKLAFAPRGNLQLAAFVKTDDVPELALASAPPPAPAGASSGSPPATPPSSSGCAGCSAANAGDAAGAGFVGVMLALSLVTRRRR
jgi:MYXO-CTERM domain-containing protein